MKTAALVLPRSRLADFVELTKPRIAIMVLFTVAAGFLLAKPATPDLTQLLHTLFGTALVASGASALNQLLERQSDSLMRRTEQRPLPTGRLGFWETLLFGWVLGLGGAAYLAFLVQSWLPAALAAITFVSYVFVYTPLKRLTTLNTLVGAIPGAMPPVIGWTAASGRLDPEALILFLILFLWQVPHFLAIAWIYREDYARAGLRMLPVVDREGRATGRQMVIYSLALLPVSLSVVMFSQGGWLYSLGALVLGLGFTRAALRFASDKSTPQARRVLHASLIYLPAMLGMLLLENWLGTTVLAAIR